MIKIENTEVFGFEAAIRGMRNPKNSWEKSDSFMTTCEEIEDGDDVSAWYTTSGVGPNDLALMKTLVKASSDHSKFMRMINVTLDITAPLYWWKEFDTYKVGTVRNSCSTMHKLPDKEFELDDFSHEHLINMFDEVLPYSDNILYCCNGIGLLEETIDVLNGFRSNYLKTKNERYWWQMIQLLPSSYNQKATVQLNYAVLRNMYRARKNHKLDEWHVFCEWIESLPHAKELICDE